ncbi:hypothetical protein GCM10010360_66310 [Streptomyces nogalater]
MADTCAMAVTSVVPSAARSTVVLTWVTVLFGLVFQKYVSDVTVLGGVRAMSAAGTDRGHEIRSVATLPKS